MKQNLEDMQKEDLVSMYLVEDVKAVMEMVYTK